MKHGIEGIGRSLRAERYRRHGLDSGGIWTQEAVAARVGCDASTLSRLENGRGNVTVELLARVAAEYGMSVALIPVADEQEAA